MLESWTAGLITLGAHWLVNPRVRWSGWKPDERPRIYYSNHTSHLDFVLLWSALPPRLRSQCRPVAASDYWDRMKLRKYLVHSVFRGVPVYRSKWEKEDSMLPMLRVLDRQESLILFPEGTRGSGNELGLFRSGLYHLARARPEIELVPVWIRNSSRVLPKGAYLPLPLLCSITFGAPVQIEAGEDKVCFLQRLRRELQDLEADDYLS